MFTISNGSSYITVKDHSNLNDHLSSIGISPVNVNFFHWKAFPEVSYGKFLVLESEWISKGMATGNTTLNLTIEDQYSSISFQGLEVVGTSFLMAPNQTAQQDGNRLLIVELELTKTKYHDMNKLYKNYTTMAELNAEYENGSMLLQTGSGGIVYNNYVMPNVSIVDYLAYIAETNFLTCYLSPSGTKPKLTSSLFDYSAIPDQVNLIYNNVAISTNPQDIHLALQSTETCYPEFVESEGSNLNFNETYFYESNVNTNTQRDRVVTFIPYMQYDHTEVFTNPSFPTVAVNVQTALLVPKARSRLQRKVSIIYQGLVPGELSADVQGMLYVYHGNSVGFRTHLYTRAWNYNNCILAIREVTCKDYIYKAILKQNLTAGSASADIYNIIKSNELPIDKDVLVRDPLGLFTGYKTGTQCYVYRECSSNTPDAYGNFNCNYVIIQGPCPPKSGS